MNAPYPITRIKSECKPSIHGLQGSKRQVNCTKNNASTMTSWQHLTTDLPVSIRLSVGGIVVALCLDFHTLLQDQFYGHAGAACRLRKMPKSASTTTGRIHVTVHRFRMTDDVSPRRSRLSSSSREERTNGGFRVIRRIDYI